MTSSFRSSGLFPPWLALALVLVTALGMFLVKQTAPSDFLDKDQQRPAQYVLDARANGNWLVQRDPSGDVMSKPPVSTWVIAVLSLPFGHFGRVQLYTPNFLAHLATALLILAWGSSVFGARAAFLGAMIFLLNPLVFRHFQLARTDSMFTLLVFLGLMLAWRAWTARESWTPFWIVAAICTLTKGPLGVVFVLGAIAVAWWWERRTKQPDNPPLRGEHLVGIILFLVIAGGWFLAAYLALQDAVVEKMVGRELVGQAVSPDSGRLPFSRPWGPTFYFVARFLPWSPLALYAFWRNFKAPAADATVRRFERALLGAILFAGVIFSIAPHQRADHLLPLIPVASLLTGRELARLLAGVAARRQQIAVCAVVVVAWAGAIYYNQKVMADSVSVDNTARVEAFARDLLEGEVPPAMLTHGPGVPAGVQFYLNTNRPWVPLDRIAAVATDADIALLITDDAWAELDARLSPFVTRRVLAEVDLSPPLLRPPARKLLRVQLDAPVDRDLDPRPRGVVDRSMDLRVAGAEVAAWRGGPWLRPTHDNVALSLANTAERPIARRVRIPGVVPAMNETVRVAAGETWSRSWPRLPGRETPVVPPPAVGLIMLGWLAWAAVVAGGVWGVRATARALERAGE